MSKRGGFQWQIPAKPDKTGALPTLAVVASGFLCAIALSSAAAQAPDWPFSGHDIHNTRNAADKRILDPSRVAELKPLWMVTTDGNVTATPSVVGGAVYAPDFGGSLWAVDAATGKVIWKNAISSYTGIPGDVSRTTPAYWRGTLIMGEGTQPISTLEGATVFALEASSGRPLWRTKVEADPVAIITSAPIVDDGVVYVGTSSKAEALNRPTAFRGASSRSGPTRARFFRQFTVAFMLSYEGRCWARSPMSTPRARRSRSPSSRTRRRTPQCARSGAAICRSPGGRAADAASW